MNRRTPWAIGLILASSLSLAACATDAPTVFSPAPTQTIPSLGSLRSGFYDPTHPPAPEGTISPAPDSWSDAHAPAGYTAVLLSYGTDAPTKTLIAAVTAWAAAEKVALTAVVPSGPDTLISSVYDAMKQKPDVIIGVGNEMVDPLAAVTPSALDQQFLVVGAELAEPTANVTAADWTGASFRGEGLGTPSKYDPSSFTPERAGRAVRAGMAAVLNHLTGIVVWVR